MKKVSLKKQKTLSKLKKELDSVFSKFIRQGATECYTCGGKGTLQAGHFVSRTYLSTRWDEDNVRPQCVGCNILGRGKPLDFEDRLIKDLGPEKVQALKAKRKELLKPTRAFYEQKIAHYQALITE